MVFESEYPSHTTPEGQRFAVGDTVSFVRNSLGYTDATGNIYETKVLTGVIVKLCYTQDNYKNKYYYAAIKAECEYGEELPFNHTKPLGALTKIEA